MATIVERTTTSRDRPAPVWKDFAYTGPDTIAGQYMRRFWQPVALARDLAPGKARPIRVMSQDLTGLAVWSSQRQRERGERLQVRVGGMY